MDYNFRVGDCVQCIDARWSDFIKKDAFYTVSAVNASDLTIAVVAIPGRKYFSSRFSWRRETFGLVP